MKSRDRRYEFFLQVRKTSYHGIVVLMDKLQNKKVQFKFTSQKTGTCLKRLKRRLLQKGKRKQVFVKLY
jgi:hypothetical protein